MTPKEAFRPHPTASESRRYSVCEQTFWLLTCNPQHPVEPDGVPEAIRLKPAPGRGYIAATQWHPEFHKKESDTLDDTAILQDFLAACVEARKHPVRPGKPVGVKERATRLLKGALRRDRMRKT